MSIRFTTILALVLALFASSGLQAKSKPESVPVKPEEFLAMRDEIEDTIRKSGAFREMDLNERKEVTRALERMQATLSEVASVDDLDPPVRTQLYNDQELINHVLTKAQADDKVICQRTKRVGTKMYTNTCLTVGERRRSQESVEQELLRAQRQFPKEVE
jgi:hypothetical protein